MSLTKVLEAFLHNFSEKSTWKDYDEALKCVGYVDNQYYFDYTETRDLKK